jgi:hypothetical protein
VPEEKEKKYVATKKPWGAITEEMSMTPLKRAASDNLATKS